MKGLAILLVILVLGCANPPREDPSDLFVVILGIAQDAGSPQIGCNKSCCKDLWGKPAEYQKVISLGIVDRKNNSVWMLDATPDFKEQLDHLMSYLPNGDISSLKGVFLTHAHIGHYTGLMDLGREAMGASSVPVFAMPKMKKFLTTNGPWSQLVTLENIAIQELKADSMINLNPNLRLTPFLVPHRDEFSETVGYKVESESKSFIFIPDIDKWHKWNRSIKTEVKNTDYAFLDGAFFSETELPNRDMSEIPHPYVPETIELFAQESTKTKQKIIFIHLNHTNPLLRDGQEVKKVEELGFNVGREGRIYPLE